MAGLLGDKFLLLTDGSPDAPSIHHDMLLRSRDPVNYESVLQSRGTTDVLANVLAISNSIRELLDKINQGHGLLAELACTPISRQS